MGFIQPCYVFHFGVEDGARAFCVAEMFISIYNFLMAIFYVPEIYLIPFVQLDSKRATVSQFMSAFIGGLFMTTLIIQAVLGWLLYFMGARDKNVTICWWWISTAIVNFTCPWILFFCEGQFRVSLLYLFYVLYGIWIVYGFILWAKESGEAQHLCAAVESGGSNHQFRRLPTMRRGSRGSAKSGGNNPRLTTTAPSTSNFKSGPKVNPSMASFKPPPLKGSSKFSGNSESGSDETAKASPKAKKTKRSSDGTSSVASGASKAKK